MTASENAPQRARRTAAGRFRDRLTTSFVGGSCWGGTLALAAWAFGPLDAGALGFAALGCFAAAAALAIWQAILGELE